MDKMNEVERCVSCGTTTPYVMKQSIHERLYYIEGAGQLCENCHSNSINRNIRSNIFLC